MANKNMQEIVSYSKEQILENLSSIEKELLNIRFMRVSTKFDNVSRIKELRKQKARLLTIFNQKFKWSKASA